MRASGCGRMNELTGWVGQGWVSDRGELVGANWLDS